MVFQIFLNIYLVKEKYFYGDKKPSNYGAFIVVKGAPRLGAARRHPPTPRLKGGDTPS